VHLVRRRLALAGAVLALVGVAAGCGGDDASDEDPTAAWASGFCSAVTDWTDELQSVTSEFSDTSNLSQEGLQSAAEDMRAATQTLVDDLKDLGRPETESGEEVENSLNELSDTLESETAEIEDTAEGVSNLTDLPDAITTMTSSLSAMATAFANTLTAIQNADAGDELQTALEDSPECADISSS
jgi:methyl-accepting chemotaxis protein